jgi:hypothetical protein
MQSLRGLCKEYQGMPDLKWSDEPAGGLFIIFFKKAYLVKLFVQSST